MERGIKGTQTNGGDEGRDRGTAKRLELLSFPDADKTFRASS